MDLNDFDTAEAADMVVMSNGQATDWRWTFAGPGHPQSVALADRLGRERLRKDREQAEAVANGRRWKAENDTPEEARRRGAEFIVDRLIGWSPITLSGKDYPFTRENAIALLIDPKKASLAVQAMEFLANDRSFTPPSAKR